MAGVKEIYANDITITTNKLGAGGFGLVFEAKWRNRKVAAKKLIITSEENAELNKELDNLSRLRHANIVEFFGKTMIDSEFHIIMEYADCGSLDYYLHDEKSRLKNMTYLALHNLMFQCAQAVKYLHNQNPIVLHRDLKPNNLLLFDDYRTLKICDFGTVREIASKMTSSVGTPAYIAPEVLEGKIYTEKCDVYSFGIILWEVMSRKKPFHHLENRNALAINNLSTRGSEILALTHTDGRRTD
ncbi:mitogen-activated protein kinase kinase kinase 7 isoform X2 [Drosophila virilis]|uniref:mitogen-activated protein kinase kinase kinase 7 isoform X2 n=1 Tax=Drosophila virilis TaxID=7244 RepID=UPI0038B38FE0